MSTVKRRPDLKRANLRPYDRLVPILAAHPAWEAEKRKMAEAQRAYWAKLGGVKPKEG
jgi:hypothetical protein